MPKTGSHGTDYCRKTPGGWKSHPPEAAVFVNAVEVPQLLFQGLLLRRARSASPLRRSPRALKFGKAPSSHPDTLPSLASGPSREKDVVVGRQPGDES